MRRSLLPIIMIAMTSSPGAEPIFSAEFTGFAGLGFEPSPTPGALSSEFWRISGLSDGDTDFGGTHREGDFARGLSAGGVTAGGVYAFDTDEDPSSENVGLGIQATGSDFSPGAISLRVPNLLPTIITGVDVMYDLYVFNNGNRSTGITFSLGAGEDGPLVEIPDLAFTTPAEASPTPGWERHSRSFSVADLSLDTGTTLRLDWRAEDLSGGGSRDEWALDNVLLSARTTPVTEVVEPNSLALLLAGCLSLLVGHLGRATGRPVCQDL